MATGLNSGIGLDIDSIIEDTATALTSALTSSGLVDSEQRVPGRPRKEIDVEEVEYLKGLNFSNVKIAELIGVSRSTLYRDMERMGINICKVYTTISDGDLNKMVESIKVIHPNDGERLMIGHLHRLNVYVPRHRVRASIHRVDPINTAIRRSVTVRRRVYYVEGPNSLWHIDGHHKLIKWRLVTHGGIDGYSRTIVYLRCSVNNKARTVLSSFLDAVSKYGVPNKVRSDLGGENQQVWEYLIEQNGTENAVVVGSSTHNERIERLWRDVQRCVSVLFGDLFRQMEEDGILDCLNELDMYCLHKVFLPRINSALDSFVQCWNNHPVSTCNNQTPNQLFIQGALSQNMQPSTPNPIGNSNVTLPSAHPAVMVPRSSFVPCYMLEYALQQIDILAVVDDFGYEIYRDVSNIIGNHIQTCTICFH